MLIRLFQFFEPFGQSGLTQSLRSGLEKLKHLSFTFQSGANHPRFEEQDERHEPVHNLRVGPKKCVHLLSGCILNPDFQNAGYGKNLGKSDEFGVRSRLSMGCRLGVKDAGHRKAKLPFRVGPHKDLGRKERHVVEPFRLFFASWKSESDQTAAMSSRCLFIVPGRPFEKVDLLGELEI